MAIEYTKKDKDQSVSPSSSELRQITRWRLTTFWSLLIGYVGYYICRGNLAAAFPLLEQEFGYSNIQLGLIASLSEIAYAVGKFINGPLTDRIGGRRIFFVGMAGAIFWNLIFSLSSSLTAFIVIWCFCRYFLSMGWGGMTKTIANWYPRKRYGTVMGFMSVSIQFGGVAATLFAGFLVLLGTGWQGLFIYPALLLGCILIASLLLSKSEPAAVIAETTLAEERGASQPLARYGESAQPGLSAIIRTLLAMPVFHMVLIFSFLTTFLRSVFLFWTPKFLFDIGLSASTAIIQSAIFPLLGVLGTVFIGWYTDHHSRNQDRANLMWKMLVMLIVCLLAIAALSAEATPDFKLILLFLGASGFFLLGPYSMSAGCLSLDIAGAEGAGSSTGIIDGVGYIGGAVAAFAVGLMSESVGWSQVFIMLSMLSALSAISAWMMSLHFQKLTKANSNESSFTTAAQNLD